MIQHFTYCACAMFCSGRDFCSFVLNRDRIHVEKNPDDTGPVPAMLGLGFTTRRNIYLHVVSGSESREDANADAVAVCGALTSFGVRSSIGCKNDVSVAVRDGRLCEFFERYQREASETILLHGIYTPE